MMSLKQIRQWLIPPDLETPESTDQAKLLWYLLTPLFSGSLVLGVVGLIRVQGLGDAVGVTLVCSLVFFGLLLMVRRGKLRLPSVILPTLILLASAWASVENGGVKERNLAGFFLTVIVASLLLGPNSVPFFGVVVLGILWLFHLGSSYDILPRQVQSEPELTQFVIVAITWVLSTYLLYYAVTWLNDSRNAAQSHASALKIRTETLFSTQSHLKKRTEELERTNNVLLNEIRERKSAEEALKQHQFAQQVMLDAVPGTIFHVTNQGIVISYKLSDDLLDARESIVPLETGTSCNILDILPIPLQEICAPAMEWVMTHQLAKTIEVEIPSAHNHIHAELQIVPIGCQEMLLLLRDISEQKAHTEAINQKQRLESLGVLAGGIAHDFNNFLTSIMANASLAKRKLNDEEPGMDHIDRILLTSEHAAGLIRQLLAYAGHGTNEKLTIDINDLANNCLAILEAAVPGNIRLTLKQVNEMLYSYANGTEIQQVLINLVINASDAIGAQDGSISVSVTSTSVGDDVVKTQFVGKYPKSGSYVVLEVCDDGPGIPEVVLRRIFEPYFSTKGQGRGMGLSTALGIIESHGGGLVIRTDPETGTCFKVLLPRVHVSEIPSIGQCTRQPKQSECRQTVLLVDDSTPLRELTRDMLELLDISVLEASNGQECLDLVAERYENISLIILDMEMPILNGFDTLLALQEMRITIPIVVSTGFSKHIGSDSVQRTVAAFLSKPYDFDELARVLTPYLDLTDDASRLLA